MVNRRVMEERNVPLNNPHHSTADLLSWSEIRRPDYSSATNRSNQPSDGITEVLGGGQITNEEAESLNKNVSYRKNCSGHKLKEMTGSDIFSDNGGKDDPNHHQTRIHYHQDQQSQISFSGEENVTTPKKPTTLNEAAKQKELSRSVQTEADSKCKKKQISNTKTKAISGHHDIFASPESQHRRGLAAAATQQQEVQGNRNMEESAPRRSSRASVKPSSSNGQSGNRLFGEEQHVVRSSKKIHSQLTSNGIFKSEKIPPGYSEKMQSSAKKREMSGHNIFADGKSEYRDYYGGARRPPGGESSISLV